MVVRRRTLAAGAIAGVALLAAGCSGGGEDDLLVFAASSLTSAFAEIESEFEAQNPAVDVVVSFAGSSALREQLLDGAPVDVFASANFANIATLRDAGLVDGTGTPFATNALTVSVPSGNPADVSGIADFANSDLAIGLCAQDVPCGLAAIEVLEVFEVDASVDTFEPNVAALAARLAEGELDSALVYETDVIASSGRLESLGLGERREVRLDYSVIALNSSTHVADADAFVDFLSSVQGQEILAEHGFGPGVAR